MNAAVVITGAGVVTPIGQSPEALHDALCLGAAGIDRVSAFATEGLPCDRGASVDAAMLQRALAGHPVGTIDRTGQLTIVAARRAIDASGIASGPPVDIGLVLGTMFSSARTIAAFDRRAQVYGPDLASPLDFSNTVLNAAAGQAGIRLALRGVNTTIGGGAASGTHAIAYASDLVASGRAPALLAGGVEELSFESLAGFCRAGLACGTNGRPGHRPIPFDAQRTGLALAEGAGLVMLETIDAARRRGATILAEIAGHAAANDPDALVCGACGRATITRAMRAALDRARLSPSNIDAISASANGSLDADREEAAAIAELFEACPDPPIVTAIKSVLGETLGASGPLQVIAMIEAMRDGRVPGIRGFEREGDSMPGDSVLGNSLLGGMLSASTRHREIRAALFLAVSLDGGCRALVLRAPLGDRP